MPRPPLPPLANFSAPQIPVVCVSTTDWAEIWGSRQQLMLRLAAAGQRVLFVERQVGPEHLARDGDLRRRKLAAWQGSALRQAADNLWLWQPPLMLPGRYYSPALNALGQRRLAARLQTVCAGLGFRRPLLWLYPPHSAPLIGRCGERLVLYHCIERFVGGQSGRKRQVMLAQEESLLRRADLVFAHAEGLQRLYAPLTRRPIGLAPSAADVEHFQSTSEVHPAIAGIPRPRLVLAGTLDGRIDVSLLHRLAQDHPAWQLVLVGPQRAGRVELAPLLALPNVHALGPQPFAALPSLLNGGDALLIPYVRNELTEYISPIKLYEYLASGVPIVSTDLPEARPLSAYVSLADGPAAFCAAVARVLQEDNPEQRQARRLAAQAHSWEHRLATIWSQVVAVLEEKGYAPD